jgi:ABC-2 type transport system ATP-binding protein
MEEMTSTDTAQLTEVDSSLPLLRASGLGLRGGRGWVFRDVNLAVPDAGLAAIAGPSGSGRSMLLLTLAGRARPSTGTVSLAGQTSVPALRRAVAIARITGAAELEPDLRVRDHLTELRALLGNGIDFAAARETVGLTAAPEERVAELDTVQHTLLSLALAMATKPTIIVLDDLDRHATPEDAGAIWAALDNLTGAGIAVIASCVHPQPAAMLGATVVHLPRPDKPDPDKAPGTPDMEHDAGKRDTEDER